MQPEHTSPQDRAVPDKTIRIDGVTYYAAADVARAIGVTRQTLWRWRSDGKVPPGQRFRDRQVVFSHEEFEAVREYANRLEPAAPGEQASRAEAGR